MLKIMLHLTLLYKPSNQLSWNESVKFLEVSIQGHINPSALRPQDLYTWIPSFSVFKFYISSTKYRENDHNIEILP